MPNRIYTFFQTDHYRLTSQSVGTIFAGKKTQQFYTFTHNRNKRNKMRKILENQRFEALRKALRMLYASFTQTYTLAKNLS
jgi:hypothetical protein